MPAGHLSTETRFTEGFVCTQKLVVEGRPLARRRKRGDTEEDARDVTGSDNAPPRIACTHTHKRGLPRIQDDGDDAIPSACPRALRFPPRPAACLNRPPRLNALRYQSFPQCFPTYHLLFISSPISFSSSFHHFSLDRKFSKRGKGFYTSRVGTTIIKLIKLEERIRILEYSDNLIYLVETIRGVKVAIEKPVTKQFHRYAR